MTQFEIFSDNKNFSPKRSQSASPPKIRKKTSDNNVSKDDLDLLSLKDKNIDDLDLPFLKEKLSEDKTLLEKFIKSEDINKNIFVVKHAKNLSPEQINKLIEKTYNGFLIEKTVQNIEGKQLYINLFTDIAKRLELSSNHIKLLLQVSLYSKRPARNNTLQSNIEKPDMLMELANRSRLSPIDKEHNKSMTVLIASAKYNTNQPLLKKLIEHPCLHTHKEKHDEIVSDLHEVIRNTNVTL